MASSTILPISEFVSNRKLSIKEFNNRRNMILIKRDTGGLGDILMIRMLFENFKKQMPDCRIVFACPTLYHSAVEDHPYIDEIVDSATVDISKYIISYDISNACGTYEARIAPRADLHRSDIWARRCGITLDTHDMHFNLNALPLQQCREYIDAHRVNDNPVVLLTPVSSTVSKDLTVEQLQAIEEFLLSRNYNVFGLHSKVISGIKSHTITNITIKEFLGFIAITDYIITVDTSAFHASNGFQKPTTAVFGWADGKVYGQYHNKLTLIQKHRDNGDWHCGPCYVWSKCPVEPISKRKPCITTLSTTEIINGIEKMLNNY